MSDTLNNELKELLDRIRQAKPEERNELSRRYAITITELEKLQAYFELYVVNYVRG